MTIRSEGYHGGRGAMDLTQVMPRGGSVLTLQVRGGESREEIHEIILRATAETRYDVTVGNIIVVEKAE